MSVTIHVHEWNRPAIHADRERWRGLWSSNAPVALSRHPDWLFILHDALRQEPYLLEAADESRTLGILPLAYVHSRLFGKFLVSLPYLNTAGVMTFDSPAPDHSIANALIDKAVELADRLDVRYLELRHELRHAHDKLNHELTTKVHMRLPLPDTREALWAGFSPKVRNQIRKGESQGLTVAWGDDGAVLADFYRVFSRNMRDLGTPVYPERLFREIATRFRGRAEFCLVKRQSRPIAAALLLHGCGITEVPSASSLREFNSTNANMLMYWHLLCRAVERGQQTFDFGRSSVDSNTYRFKKQWGAEPTPAIWQYYARQGDVGAMRPDSDRNQRLIQIWRRLPLWLTRQLGPLVVRGIP